MSDQPRQLDYATPQPRRRRPLMWLSMAVGIVLLGGMTVSLIGFGRARAERAAALKAAQAAIAAQASQTALRATSNALLSEEEKIQRLIDAVASATDITFIRNGKEHTSADASAHLKRKYEAAKDKIRLAREFIEHIASRSSLSGEPYRVRLSDGTEQTAQHWLTKCLEELESMTSGQGSR